MLSFHPSELLWTDERVRRFWAWMSQEPEFASEYFAHVFGDVLIWLAKKYGLTGKALDYGCGPGFLLEKLPPDAVGVEFSEESIAKARSNGLNVQCPSSLSPNSFDSAFFIETIEHLDDVALASALIEIRDLLKPHGRILITTPYRERLALGKTICPDCGAVFHRMQHVRSWSEDSIQQTMNRYGFTTLACWGTTFMRTPLETSLVASYRQLKSIIFGGEPLRENLIYVGAKC